MIEGCNNLIIHLTYNQPDRLERARQLFDEGTDPPFAQFDLDSRWVAAHLRDIADDLGTTSVWAHLPPSVPPAAARAMTLGEPPVLSLWPPQLELLNGMPNPLDPAVRRLVLSFPTSAGKTLMAQYIVAAHVASGAGSACVVVPTHSLGRELRRDLDRRLSTIARQAADAGPLGLPLPPPPSAVVMTPEKLAAHLRLEPNRMLSEYSLYVIDEAHLVGDAERGWVLESALGFLHGATLHHEPPDRGALRRAGQPGPRGGLAGGRRPSRRSCSTTTGGGLGERTRCSAPGWTGNRWGAHPANAGKEDSCGSGGRCTGRSTCGPRPGSITRCGPPIRSARWCWCAGTGGGSAIAGKNEPAYRDPSADGDPARRARPGAHHRADQGRGAADGQGAGRADRGGRPGVRGARRAREHPAGPGAPAGRACSAAASASITRPCPVTSRPSSRTGSGRARCATWWPRPP